MPISTERPPLRFPAGIFSGGDGSSWLPRVLAIGVVAVVLVVLATNFFVYVEPGHVGIVIHRMGGGIDKDPLGPGLHVRNPLATAIEEYPVYMQTLVLTRESQEGSPNNEEINVNSSEGQPVSLDVSMSFELNPALVPQLYATFRTDIMTVQRTYVRQAIRQALQEVVGGEEIAAIIGPKKAQAVARAEGLLAQRLAPYGIQVKQFTINELRAPQPVIDAINTKNVMQQQALTAQNELQKNIFQAQGDSITRHGPRQGHPRRGRGAGRGQPPPRREHHPHARPVRDDQALGRQDAAGHRRRHPHAATPGGEAVKRG